MKWRDYLASRAVPLCFLGIALIFLGGFAALASSVRLALFLSGGLLAAVLAGLAMSFWRVRRRLDRLEKKMRELPEPYLLGELLPEPEDAVEREYYRVMKAVSRSAIGIAEEARREKEEYCRYVESWIHEIKTPLTACSLILSNDSDPRKLKRELRRADNLTENILYYARLRTAEKDTMIREVSVAEAVDQAVQSQMELLVAAGIRVQVQGNFTVATDSKAVCFMLKQLLVNCAQYCPGCQITVTAKDGTVTVEDDGIGIPPHELPRVTQRGFTGTNGRIRGGSTGMGLYLVREMCGRLNMTMTVESEEGKYTRIRLTFGALTKR